MLLHVQRVNPINVVLTKDHKNICLQGIENMTLNFLKSKVNEIEILLYHNFLVYMIYTIQTASKISKS